MIYDVEGARKCKDCGVFPMFHKEKGKGPFFLECPECEEGIGSYSIFACIRVWNRTYGLEDKMDEL